MKSHDQTKGILHPSFQEMIDTLYFKFDCFEGHLVLKSQRWERVDTLDG